jgi:hypothetical protein
MTEPRTPVAGAQPMDYLPIAKDFKCISEEDAKAFIQTYAFYPAAAYLIDDPDYPGDGVRIVFQIELPFALDGQPSWNNLRDRPWAPHKTQPYE